MTWIYYALGSVILFTTLNLIQRVISIDSKYPKALSVVFNVYAGLTAVLIFFLSGQYKNIALPEGWLPWILLLTSSTFYALFEKLRFKVSQLLDASVNSTVATTSTVVSFIVSTIFLGEDLNLYKVVGFLLIMISLVMVSYKKGVHSTLKGLGIAIFSYSMLGSGYALDKVGTRFFAPDTYNIFIWTIPIIIVYLPYVKWEELKHEAKIASWKVVVLAILNVIGYLLMLKALALADVTKVIPIVQTSILATIICGIIFLKERDLIIRKLLAGALAIVGVVLLIQ